MTQRKRLVGSGINILLGWWSIDCASHSLAKTISFRSVTFGVSYSVIQRPFASPAADILWYSHGVLAETSSHVFYRFSSLWRTFAILALYFSTLLCCLTHEGFLNISCIYDGMILNVARIAGWESIELIRAKWGENLLYTIKRGTGGAQELKGTGRYIVTSSWNIDS